MKVSRKILFISLLLSLILSVGVVFAQEDITFEQRDIQAVSIETDEETESISNEIETKSQSSKLRGEREYSRGNGTLGSAVSSQKTSFNTKSDIIASSEFDSLDVLALNEDNGSEILTWGNEHSFVELQNLINQANHGDVINLSHDYSIDAGGSTIKIQKSLTINGNNHYLDGANRMSIFNIIDTADYTISVVFKNIKFINGGNKSSYGDYSNSRGGAILHNSRLHTYHSLTLIGCSFEGNGAAVDGGAIYWEGGVLKIHNSTFSNNLVNQGHGGAVFFKSNVSGIEIINCNFESNKVQAGLVTSDILFNGNWYDYYTYFNNLGADNRPHPPSGGAVFCELTCYMEPEMYDLHPHLVNHVVNSVFFNNQVGEENQMSTAGGAIHAVGFLEVHDSNFTANKAYDEHGGAILSNYMTKIFDSNFKDNVANCGGAISCFGYLELHRSTFKRNGHEVDTTWAEAQSIGELVKVLENIPYVGAVIGGIFSVLDIFGISDAIYTISKGGGVYTGTSVVIYECDFKDNYALEYGGAVFAENNAIVENSNFTSNTARRGDSDIKAAFAWQGRNRDGGAIHTGRRMVVKNSYFNRNLAHYDGGALYSHGTCDVYDSFFKSNTAGYYGGAISAKILGKISYSNFTLNTVTKSTSDGGAIFIYDPSNPTIDFCQFNRNSASSDGGAIFVDDSDSTLTVSNSIFRQNVASEDGGAFYCRGKTKIYDSGFYSNDALGDGLARSFGGAVNSKGSLTVYNCEFIDNNAYRGGSRGGAIYADSDLVFSNSNFEDNSAEDGGAVYAELINKEVYNITFSRNKATSGDGGAIYINGKCDIRFNFCTFEQNSAIEWGGAIFTFHGSRDVHTNPSKVKIANSKFIKNTATHGGAVFAGIITEVSNSVFTNNKATLNSDGGAIYINRKCDPIIHHCIFEENSAFSGEGGAIYIDSIYSYLKLYDCIFKKNSAKSGGAVYARQLSKYVSNLTFVGNKASSGDGGALYVANDVIGNHNIINEFSFCTFENNTASGKGGGLCYYSKYATITKMADCTFSMNVAKSGGAVCVAEGQLSRIAGSKFYKNNATSGDGGAVYIRNAHPTDYNIVTVLSTCIFEDNNAHSGKGGGLCMGSSYDSLTIWNCQFNRNSAAKGGGVYSNKVTSITHSFFIGNKATAKDGDGGGIYVKSDCDFNTYCCRYENNKAMNRGGAIYTDYIYSDIGIDYCTFVNNTALKKDYDRSGGICLPGHSVFNSGYYKYINLCWFGKNNPDTTNQMVEYKRGADDKSHTPTNILKVGMKVDNYNPLVGNTYTVTIYFIGNGLELNKWNLYHSEGSFAGGPTFSNIKPYVNDITANFVVKWAGDNNIHGYIDNQYLFLKVNGQQKNPSTVKILNCENVTYPNALKVTYQINPMSASTYLIKDEQGNIIKSGKLTDPTTLYVEGLAPGSYSITISNTETLNNLAGSDTKSFNILGGSIEALRVVVYNKTYPENVECMVYASVDGEYNLTVAGNTYPITVENGVGYVNIGTLDNGTYEAHVYFFGNEFYAPSSNTTTFVVNPLGKGTYFTVDVNASVIDYLQTAIVIHNLPENATGYISYYLSDGTFLGELPVKENLTLPILNAGFYVIIANYTGDENYSSVIDTVGLQVNKIDSGFNAFVIDKDGVYQSWVSYGVNAIVFNTFHDGATGTITYYLSNGNLLAQTSLNKTFILPLLNVGVHSINASYSGDRNFKPSHIEFPINVNKIGSTFQAFCQYSNQYGQDINVNNNLPQDAEGTIKYYLCGVDQNVRIFIGEASAKEIFVLSGFDVGYYSIDCHYSGDQKYVPELSSFSFCVVPVETEFTLNLTNDEIIYGETSTVFPVLKFADGNITYYLGDGTFLGVFSVFENLTLPVLDAGTYVIIGYYSGDNNYNNATANITLIVNKANPAFGVNINVSEIKYGATTFITSALFENATGNITCYLSDGTFLGQLPINGNLTLPILNAGTYVIIAKYSGDKNFFNVTTNTILTVVPIETEVFVEMLNTTYRSDDYLIITIKDINGNPVVGVNVTVDLNGAIIFTTDENGQINVSTYYLSANTYNATITFNGTINYLNSSNTTTVIINKRPSVMIIKPLTTSYQVHKYLVATVLDDLGNPISNAEIYKVVNGITYLCPTDKKGNGKLLIRLDSKKYMAHVVFDNENYTSSNHRVMVTVLKGNPNLVAKKKTFKASTKVKKFKVSLKYLGKPLSKKTLILKIKGKTFKAKTNDKGLAVFKIQKFTKKGKFKANVSYKGDYLFNKVSKKVNIVIK